MGSSNEQILDAAIRHAIFVERFKGAEAKKLLRLYNQLADDVIAKLLKRDPWAVSGRYTTARLVRLLEDVQEIIKAHGGALRLDLLATLDEFAGIETEYLVRTVQTAIPAAVTIDVAQPAATLVRAAIRSNPFQGRVMKEWFEDLDRATFSRLRQAIRLSVVEGETVVQAAKRVQGVIETSRGAAEMVARTAISHTANEVRAATYRENQDIVKAIRWVSTLDGRTSAVCRARDGQTFEMGKGPRPPAHPNCRSTTVPVLKSLREMGFKNVKDLPESTRASMNGQVPASTTYQAWLAKQSRSFQDEVLGPTKAKLFREGGLTLDKFVARDGSELTLPQLRERYAEAFAEAGL